MINFIKLGGTLIETKNKLLEMGAKKVSAYVTHAVFPQESWKKFTTKSENQFSKFYATDSCPETAELLKDKEPFHILSIAPMMANLICDGLI